jgi:hypothetical protein
MGVDAEGFLEDKHTGERAFFFRARHECLHRAAVGYRQRMFVSRYIRHLFPFEGCRWSFISQTIV